MSNTPHTPKAGTTHVHVQRGGGFERCVVYARSTPTSPVLCMPLLQVPCLDVHSGPFSEELEREQRQAAATAATEAAAFASLVIGIVLVGAASQSGACRRLLGTLVRHLHGVLQHVAVRVVTAVSGRVRGSGGGVRYANVSGREPGPEDL
jgi:hypothetical protein